MSKNPSALHLTDLRVLFSSARIHQRVNELAGEIRATYATTGSVHLIGVLRGAFVFTSDLARALYPLAVTVDFVQPSSYGPRTTTSGSVAWRLEPEDVRGRHVLVVEDIVDSGLTLHALRRRLLDQDPASLRIVALLDKPARRVHPVPLDFVGFRIDDAFVVGYGLDLDGRYRELPHIAVAAV